MGGGEEQIKVQRFSMVNTPINYFQNTIGIKNTGEVWGEEYFVLILLII